MKLVPEVTCIGEVLVDFLSKEIGRDLSDAGIFAKGAGGAPANVAAGLSRLGIRSSFVGKVGNDPFGIFLYTQLKSFGVDVSGITFDGKNKTRLAFVSLRKNGDRDFEFWEKHPADEQIVFRDIPFRKIERSKIVHLSSFLLLKEPARRTVFQIARYLRKKKILISFDPNIRLSLWERKSDARRTLLRLITYASIVRLNMEEAHFLTSKRSAEKCAEVLLKQGPLLVVITMGRKGCFFKNNTQEGFVPGLNVRAVDTTGCGDAFLAGLLAGLIRSGKKIDALSARDLTALCRYANASGAFVASRRGVLSALPTPGQVKKLLNEK
jgi:sugar/nucleoside kinase (ribokinase family)